MIDQLGKEVKAGDSIVWASCRMTKFTKHKLSLMLGKVIHVDTKVMFNGHIAETLLVERDAKLQRNLPASVLLIDPVFVILESNSS